MLAPAVPAAFSNGQFTELARDFFQLVGRDINGTGIYELANAVEHGVRLLQLNERAERVHNPRFGHRRGGVGGSDGGRRRVRRSSTTVSMTRVTAARASASF